MQWGHLMGVGRALVFAHRAHFGPWLPEDCSTVLNGATQQLE